LKIPSRKRRADRLDRACQVNLRQPTSSIKVETRKPAGKWQSSRRRCTAAASIRINATIRGSTRNSKGEMPKVWKASISWFTFMVRVAAAKAAPVRPQRMMPVHDAPHLANGGLPPRDPRCRWTRRSEPTGWRPRRRGSGDEKVDKRDDANASGPQACVTSTMSRQRNSPDTHQLEQGHHALTQEAKHGRAADPKLRRLTRRLATGTRVSTSLRAASLFLARLGERAIVWRGPLGRVLARNSTLPLAQRSLMARILIIKALSPAFEAFASNSKSVGTAAGQFPSATPRCPGSPVRSSQSPAISDE